MDNASAAETNLRWLLRRLPDWHRAASHLNKANYSLGRQHAAASQNPRDDAHGGDIPGSLASLEMS